MRSVLLPNLHVFTLNVKSRPSPWRSLLPVKILEENIIFRWNCLAGGCLSSAVLLPSRRCSGQGQRALEDRVWPLRLLLYRSPEPTCASVLWQCRTFVNGRFTLKQKVLLCKCQQGLCWFSTSQGVCEAHTHTHTLARINTLPLVLGRALGWI